MAVWNLEQKLPKTQYIFYNRR